MPSSTSNSDRTALANADEATTKQSVQRATLALILIMAGILMGAELSARFLFPHISQIQRRIVEDQRQVLRFFESLRGEVIEVESEETGTALPDTFQAAP